MRRRYLAVSGSVPKHVHAVATDAIAHGHRCEVAFVQKLVL